MQETPLFNNTGVDYGGPLYLKGRVCMDITFHMLCVSAVQLDIFCDYIGIYVYLLSGTFFYQMWSAVVQACNNNLAVMLLTSSANLTQTQGFWQIPLTERFKVLNTFSC